MKPLFIFSHLNTMDLDVSELIVGSDKGILEGQNYVPSQNQYFSSKSKLLNIHTYRAWQDKHNTVLILKIGWFFDFL